MKAFIDTNFHDLAKRARNGFVFDIWNEVIDFMS